MHLKSDTIKVMINDRADKVIKVIEELFFFFKKNKFCSGFINIIHNKKKTQIYTE